MIVSLVFLLVLATFSQANTDAYIEKSSEVITLTDADWSRTLNGEWMIMFFAPWCYACKAAKADYEEFATFSDEINVNVARVDITAYPGLSGRFLVTALPTFYHAIDGEFRRYNGERTVAAYRSWVLNQQWRTNTPMMWFRHPNSILMSMMSILFKSSLVLKDIHETFTITHGIPSWASYSLFVLLTIAAGIVFGMFLVTIMEWIYPPKRRPLVGGRQNEDENTEEVDTSEEEEVEEGKIDDVDEGQGDGVDVKSVEEKQQCDDDEVVENLADEAVADDKNEEDDASQDSQASSQTFKSWERISEAEMMAEATSGDNVDDLRRRNLQQPAVTELIPEDAVDKEADEDKIPAACEAGDSGHTKTE